MHKKDDSLDKKEFQESELKNKRRQSLALEPTIPLSELTLTDPIMKVTLWIGSFGVYNESILTFHSNGFVKRELLILQTFGEEQRIESGWYNQDDSAKVLKKFNSFKTHLWPELFVETETITHDGTQWKLEVCKKGGRLVPIAAAMLTRRSGGLSKNCSATIDVQSFVDQPLQEGVRMLYGKETKTNPQSRQICP